MEKAMQIMGIIAMVIELITKAMDAAEALMDPGTGKFKKELVMNAVKEAVSPETWEKIQSWVSVFINIKALFKFGSSGKDPA